MVGFIENGSLVVLLRFEFFMRNSIIGLCAVLYLLRASLNKLQSKLCHLAKGRLLNSHVKQKIQRVAVESFQPNRIEMILSKNFGQNLRLNGFQILRFKLE